MGARRRRHEGHGRDDARGRPAVQARRGGAAAGPRVRVPGRRGGRRRRTARSGWSSNRPELFEGCTEAVGEVGGFSLTAGRGPARLPRSRPPRRASPGCGCAPAASPGTARSCTTTTPSPRSPRRWRGWATTPFPLTLTDTVRAFLDADVASSPGWSSPRTTWRARCAKLGPLSRIVGATIRDTANPTMLKAGYKANVIPSTAEAVVDCRVLPGRQEAFLREVDELLGPDVTREWVTDLPPRGDAVRRAAGRGDGGRAARRGPGRADRPVHALRRHRRQVLRRAGHALLRLRARCGCRRTSTSPRCSTASTSGSRWTRCGSAPGCSTGSCRSC